ncbi:methyl-accepting chemotaxis protein [Clostridium sp. SHJSY1]|uniref:methyl-accepting chemotaxis protein n=1 Tax=Clostridium sp. SHJSY1 TaxID=2942483 RepID=UPI0028740ACC|nr:methyl-accepting chemotaxis protein [Clostridium sp. SHJSY1]MDS0527428.1 methyl-accepting chemotaxis protein [Clostridium sp. SHJSY1]
METTKDKKIAKFILNSIRGKLIISLVAICMIPLIIMGVTSYTKSKSILHDNLITTSNQTLTEVNSGLTDYFSGLSNMASALSNNIANLKDDANTDDITAMLKSTQITNKDMSSIYYGTTSSKYIMYPVEVMPSGYDPTKRPWYKQAMENKGKPIITPPYRGASTGELMITIAQTVERNGQTVGVIGMDCTLGALSDKIAQKKVGNEGFVFITDTTGVILAHPNKDSINQNLSVWDSMKSNNEGSLQYTEDGKERFGVYQTDELTGWKLIATLEQSELTTKTQAILNMMYLIVGVIGAISVALAILLSNGIAQNIKRLKEVFAKSANGDLTVSIKATTKDEFEDLAESFNHMIENISGLMKSVTDSSKEVLETSSNLASMSEEVTASVEEVAKAINEVAIGATSQAQNAQNGVEEINGLSDRLDKMAVSSNEADKLSAGTKELGSKGLSMIDTLIDKSNKTKMVTAEVSSIVEDMNESTKKINSISETISQITEQTNLLSLNASIESARAGEAGKGFAVVAEEIRKLAEQSKGSTEEIKLIIANIQEKSDTAVNAIKVTNDVVTEQDLAVGETKEIFNEILKSIGTVIDKIEEMKIAIVEIDKNKRNVVQEIEGISAVSEETASATEEVTASTEEITSAMNRFTSIAEGLQGLSEKLELEIQKFNIK